MTQVTQEQLAGMIGEAVSKAVSEANAEFIKNNSHANKLFAAPESDATKEVKKAAPVRRLMGALMERTAGTPADTFLRNVYGADTADFIKSTHQLSDYVSGGALSLPDFSETIIDGLEKMTVVRRMNPQTFTVTGALILPEETSAPDSSWIGENAATSVGTFAFGDIRLDPKRLGVDAVVSRKLIRQAERGGAAVRNLEEYIVRRLRERRAVNEDFGFLKGPGTGNSPLGIRFQIAAGNEITATNTSAATQEVDLRNMPVKLEQGNLIITSGFYVMSPAVMAYYSTLRDANGNLIYPTLQAGGSVYGYPVMKTQQVADTEVYFVNGPNIVIADDMDAEVTISTEGAYETAGGTRSLVQRGEVLIHMESASDVKLDRPVAMAVLTGLDITP